MNITPFNGLTPLYFTIYEAVTGKCFGDEVGSFRLAWQTVDPLGGRSSAG
jgi:hypothetical protein